MIVDFNILLSWKLIADSFILSLIKADASVGSPTSLFGKLRASGLTNQGASLRAKLPN